ncbi:hypothetical protein [Paenibacillus sp. WLX2291]|uniref:hypothetical protein n=1 Tax=Paenibacillus sp. WLX2291 TaxID=3296934 RepID=UPI0039841E0F
MMGWLKIWTAILLFAIVVPVLGSIVILTTVHHRGGDRLEMAMNIAVIHALAAVDTSHGGRAMMDPDVLRSTIRASFRSQMKFNEMLESSRMKDSQLITDITTNSSGSTIVTCQFSTKVKMLIPGWSEDVSVVRRIPVETKYN